MSFSTQNLIKIQLLWDDRQVKIQLHRILLLWLRDEQWAHIGLENKEHYVLKISKVKESSEGLCHLVHEILFLLCDIDYLKEKESFKQ